MADIFSKQKRSAVMASIKGSDTTPERVVRSFLFSRGYRYRKNVPYLPGRPDIVLRRYNTVIFVNGCFWHGHRGCHLYVEPKSNVDFWRAKVQRNRQRDDAVWNALLEMGWKVEVIWECQLHGEKMGETLSNLEKTLKDNLKEAEKTKHFRRARKREIAAERFAALVRQRENTSDFPIPASVSKMSREEEDSR